MDDKKQLGEICKTLDNSLTLQHPDHGEEYHSTQGALTEANALYIQSSGIMARMEKMDPNGRGVWVLDVGLGLGYNALTTISHWASQSSGVSINMISLENNPDLPRALASGNGQWMENWSQDWCGWAKTLVATDEGWEATIIHPKNNSTLKWRIIVQDALSVDLVTKIGEKVDYIWQDPFSPKNNPTMWSDVWFSKVAEVSSLETVLVTYSVARSVKDGLKEAGWNYEKIPAYGKKRNWLRATICPSG